MRRHRVLVVDDDPAVARVLRLMLEAEGLAVTVAGDVAAARGLLEPGGFDLVISDLRLPDGDGLEVLRTAGRACPGAPVVMLTAHASIPNAVEAMKLGAFDYLAKPFDNDHLKALVANALRLRDLARENTRLRTEEENRWGLAAIVGPSAELEHVREQVRLAARSDAAVLIAGETGTGKELVARAIHLQSARASGPFVAVNCGALPENLVESELFGHRRGAFTGATDDRPGRFVQADSGTVFLDEVTEMRAEAQVKLLRVLETNEVQPVGATDSRQVDVRTISATNRGPAKAVRDGVLRQDLYYRLNVFAIRVPPLREHAADIPAITARYLESRGFSPDLVGPDVLELLADHDFPGNVRELENVIESGLILSQGRAVRPEHVAERLIPGPGRGEEAGTPGPGRTLAELERDALETALSRSGGNQSQAARLLGISRATLIYRMKKHDLA